MVKAEPESGDEVGGTPKSVSGVAPSRRSLPPPSAPYVSSLEAGTLLDERYEIVRLLGAGGMGTVYQARDRTLDRGVAIKVPHAHLLREPGQRRRFEREAQAAARLLHPNICTIFDIADAGGTLYIAMAYVEGRPLTSLVDRGEPAPERLAIRIVHTLATALQAAHEVGVFHLDLKPANVVLGPNQNPVIMDFGLARLTTDDVDSQTVDASVLGTPAYMAPEQIDGDVDAVGACTDIYGLGVILYELVTGHPPFRGGLASVLMQAKSTVPQPPSQVCSSIDGRLDEICLRALEKKPCDRFPSMSEFAEALGSLAQSQRGSPANATRGAALSDGERLTRALAEGKAWEAMYHAKRLLQMNEHDAAAFQALARLARDPRGLVYVDEARKEETLNAFTRSMDVKTLVEFVREAGLLERDEGDVICRHNDPSDNMFVILRGGVGIYMPRNDPSAAELASGPDFSAGPGSIVGELAYALKRRRTATVRALQRTSLLAFSYTRLEELVRRGVLGPALSASVDGYLKDRVLKFVFDSAPYLGAGEKRLKAVGEPWQFVGDHAEVLVVDDQHRPLLTRETCPRFATERGIVLLASGELHGEHADDKTLTEGELPIVFADFPDRFVCSHARYRFDRPVTLVHIHHSAFVALDRLNSGVLHEVVDAVRRASAAQFCYDVFLSYTARDLELATRWKQGLERSGLRVYMDTQRPPAAFLPGIRAAILESLVFMPLLTEAATARRANDSWVRREIVFRIGAFAQGANIIPVNLGGGRVARFADGYAAIEAAGREAEAILEVVDVVAKIREGKLPAPCSLERELPEL